MAAESGKEAGLAGSGTGSGSREDEGARGRSAGRGFASRAVHGGERIGPPAFTPTSTPIYASTSFSYEDMATADAVFGGDEPGYVYSRHGNPTTRALETVLADLEGTQDALACGSGMAAMMVALLNDVQAGDRIVAASDLYGATAALLNNLLGTLGIRTTRVDIMDLDAVRQAVETERPRVLLFETISNPLARVANIPALVEIARATKTRVVVDNTFATPLLVNPARFGVHSVVHSTTKYLGGHGDVTGGVICATAGRIADMVELNKLTGTIPSPFDAFLTLRGVKTMPLRVARQSDSAQAVAEWLRQHPRVAKVHYPGLDDLGETAAMFNDHRRGGIVAFEIGDAGQDDVFRFLGALRMCVPATTLGDVYTLALYPPMSTHRGMTPEDRAAAGIADGLVRLSVGIEDAPDIIDDLGHALEA
jgi:cystathionine beta-lyase/cystathionine gamma-synthase